MSNWRYWKWKKNKLKENIKCLEDLSNTFEKSINEIKRAFKKINEDKEALRMNIQKYLQNWEMKLIKGKNNY